HQESATRSSAGISRLSGAARAVCSCSHRRNWIATSGVRMCATLSPAVGRLALQMEIAMRINGTPTKYPGVQRIGAQTFRIRAKVLNPKTGKPTEIDRVLTGLTILEAMEQRAKAIAEIQNGVDDDANAPKPKLGAYASDCWISSKHGNVDDTTADIY